MARHNNDARRVTKTFHERLWNKLHRALLQLASIDWGEYAHASGQKWPSSLRTFGDQHQRTRHHKTCCSCMVVSKIGPLRVRVQVQSRLRGVALVRSPGTGNAHSLRGRHFVHGAMGFGLVPCHSKDLHHSHNQFVPSPHE